MVVIIPALVLVGAALAIIPAYAEIPSPLEQYDSGVPMQDIQCIYNRVPMESPSGTPVCVSAYFVERLLAMDYTLVHPMDATNYMRPECDHAPGTYMPIEPLDYSISGGELVRFCVEPDQRWFIIELDTQGPGNLTVTVPKNMVDLRQFDHRYCTKYWNNNMWEHMSWKQISQTAESRTLQFVWNHAIPGIGYGGKHTVIDGVDYTDPDWCMGLMEAGILSKDPYVGFDPIFEYGDPNCWLTGHTLEASYEISYETDTASEISSGAIKKICAHPKFGFVEIFLVPVSAPRTLSIEIPYSIMPPWTECNGEALRPPAYWEPTANKTSYSQTFDIMLKPNIDKARVTFLSNLLPEDYHITSFFPIMDFYQNFRGDPICDGDLIAVPGNNGTACLEPETIEKLIVPECGPP